MFESIHRLKPAVVQTLSNMGADAPVEFQQRDWTLISNIVRVLKPFKEATLWLSKSDASISLGIPMITTIRKSLEVIARMDQGVMGMKRNLTDAMDTRFTNMESTIHYSAATILDSKFKHHFFRDSTNVDHAKDYIVEKIATEMGQREASSNQVT